MPAGPWCPAERLAVHDQHHGNLIGRMDPPTDAGAGPVTQVHIARGNSHADNVLALVDAGVHRGRVHGIRRRSRPARSGTPTAPP